MKHKVTNLRVNRNLAGPDNDQAWQCHGGGKRHVHGNAPNKLGVEKNGGHKLQLFGLYPAFPEAPMVPKSEHNSCHGLENCVRFGPTCVHGTIWRRGDTKPDLSLTAQNKTVGSHMFKLSGNPNAKSGHAESSPHMKPLTRAYVRVLRPRACLPCFFFNAHAVLCLHSDTFGNIDVVCSCPGVAYRFVGPKPAQWISSHQDKRLKTVTKDSHHNLTRDSMT